METIKSRRPNSTIVHIGNMHLLVIEQKNDSVWTLPESGNGNGGGGKKYINELVIREVHKEVLARKHDFVDNI